MQSMSKKAPLFWNGISGAFFGQAKLIPKKLCFGPKKQSFFGSEPEQKRMKSFF